MDKLTDLLDWATRNTKQSASPSPTASPTTTTTTTTTTAAPAASSASAGGGHAAWLDALIADPTDGVAALLKSVAEGEESGGAGVVDTLEQLQELVEDDRHAQRFYKDGGIQLMLHTLRKGSSEAVRAAAAWVLGSALSNNKDAQIHAARHAPMAVTTLLRELRRGAGAHVASKLLFALSGLVRHSRAHQGGFLRESGFAVLAKVLASTGLAAQRKAAFLVQQLLMENSELAPAAAKDGALAALVPLLASEDVDAREKAMAACVAGVRAGGAAAVRVLVAAGAGAQLDAFERGAEGDEGALANARELRNALGA